MLLSTHPARRWLTVATAAGLLAASLAACSTTPASTPAASEPGSTPGDTASSAPAEPTTIRLGLSAVNASHLWTVIAEDNDLFSQFGVKLELVTFQGGASQVVPAILGNSVELGIGNGQQNLLAHLQEPDLTMIASPMIGSPLSLVARSGITSIDELKGKTISVNAVGGSEDYFSGTRYLQFKGASLDDFKFITGGPTSARVSALLAGSVDAVFCSPPDVQRITAAGGVVLGAVNDAPAVAASLAYGIMGKASWFAEHHDAMVNFMRGYQATQAFMRDPANRDAVEKTIETRLNTDATGAAETYDFWVGEVASRIDPTGVITEQNIQQVLTNAKEDGVEGLGDLKPADLTAFYDNTFAEEAAAK